MSSGTLLFNQKELIGAWVAERVGQSCSWGDFYAMGVELGGKIVAGLVFSDFTGKNAFVHLAVDRMTRRLPELFDHGTRYAFDQCGLLRVTAPVEETNTKSLNIVRKVGFEQEATLRRAGENGQDSHLFVLWPENFRRGRRHG